MTEEIKVIGIDPAPGKESTVFDGKIFCNYTSLELEKYIKRLSVKNTDVLICWDAPLSFSTEINDSPFTQRIIEKFFMREEWAKTPKGISVLGYSGCPHWTISQYILGYPQISPYAEKLTHPFELIFDKDEINKSVTEVHPAVAIWQWCKDIKNKKNENWNYKKKIEVFNQILDILIKKRIVPDNLKKEITNDDQLDAFIAWKLGCEWIGSGKQVENDNEEMECKNKVMILGDNDTGSFLLPNNAKLSDDFEKFKNELSEIKPITKKNKECSES